MKTPYAKFIIGAIMMSAPGYAAAQSFRYDFPTKEHLVRFEKELKLSNQAKIDTIYKYEYDNLYIELLSDLNTHAQMRAAVVKPLNKRIRAACRKMHSKNPEKRAMADQEFLRTNGEYVKAFEKYSKLDSAAINDFFVRSLITREYRKNQR